MNYSELIFESEKPDILRIEALAKALGYDQLKSLYQKKTLELNRNHQPATVKTSAEKYLYSHLASATRMEIFTSVWIGRSCVDFFIPGIAGDRASGRAKMFGLIIESNGSVHNYELKMIKDERRMDNFSDLRIGVLNIENYDLGSSQVKNLIDNIRLMPRLSWRSKQRLWARVHAWTLMANSARQSGVSYENA